MTKAEQARVRGAVAGRPGGNLATWKPELSRVCAAATAERAAHCDRNASTVPLEASGAVVSPCRGIAALTFSLCPMEVW
jgi:hypothetical protein